MAIQIVKAPMAPRRGPIPTLARERAEAIKSLKVGESFLWPGDRQNADPAARWCGLMLGRSFRVQANGKEGSYFIREA